MKKAYTAPTLVTEEVTLGVFGIYHVISLPSWLEKLFRRWRMK